MEGGSSERAWGMAGAHLVLTQLAPAPLRPPPAPLLLTLPASLPLSHGLIPLTAQLRRPITGGLPGPLPTFAAPGTLGSQGHWAVTQPWSCCVSTDCRWARVSRLSSKLLISSPLSCYLSTLGNWSSFLDLASPCRPPSPPAIAALQGPSPGALEGSFSPMDGSGKGEAGVRLCQLCAQAR